MRFVVKKEIFEELPSACFGVVMAKGIDNNNAYPEIEQFLDESIQAAMQRFEGRKVKEDPDIFAPIPELTDRKVSRKMEREGAELWNRK